MLKRMSPFVVPKEVREKEEMNHQLAEWAFQSHNWIEVASGVYKCEWCIDLHYSTMGISPDFPLCPKNPCLLRHVSDHYNKIFSIQIEDSDMIIEAITSGNFPTFEAAEQAIVSLYVPDIKISRSGISMALEKLKKIYKEKENEQIQDSKL